MLELFIIKITQHYIINILVLDFKLCFLSNKNK